MKIREIKERGRWGEGERLQAAMRANGGNGETKSWRKARTSE
jgi:hypothetical protein